MQFEMPRPPLTLAIPSQWESEVDCAVEGSGDLSAVGRYERKTDLKVSMVWRAASYESGIGKASAHA